MLEPRSAYGCYGAAGRTTGKTEPEDGWVGEYRRMPYGTTSSVTQTAAQYPAAMTAATRPLMSSYRRADKPSNVRGEHFHYFRYAAEDEDGTILRFPYKAITAENAMKQHIRFCKQNGLKNIEKSP